MASSSSSSSSTSGTTHTQKAKGFLKSCKTQPCNRTTTYTTRKNNWCCVTNQSALTIYLKPPFRYIFIRLFIRRPYHLSWCPGKKHYWTDCVLQSGLDLAFYPQLGIWVELRLLLLLLIFLIVFFFCILTCFPILFNEMRVSTSKLLTHGIHILFNAVLDTICWVFIYLCSCLWQYE